MVTSEEEQDPGSEPGGQGRMDRVKKRVLIGAIAILGVLLLGWIGYTALPRWWAQRIGNLVDGRLYVGSILGMSFGLVLTLASVAILAMGWRLRTGWKRMSLFVLGALVVSLPNLATLSIVLSASNAAHAAERTLDVDGPGFRWGTLLGVLAAVAVATAFGWLSRSRRRLKERDRDRGSSDDGGK